MPPNAGEIAPHTNIKDLVARAAECGLELEGELSLSHSHRPAHWKRVGLDFTYIRLAFRRR